MCLPVKNTKSVSVRVYILLVLNATHLQYGRIGKHGSCLGTPYHCSYKTVMHKMNKLLEICKPTSAQTIKLGRDQVVPFI
jgi:hypothetical protein